MLLKVVLLLEVVLVKVVLLLLLMEVVLLQLWRGCRGRGQLVPGVLPKL